jgi:hypothetical protein
VRGKPEILERLEKFWDARTTPSLAGTVLAGSARWVQNLSRALILANQFRKRVLIAGAVAGALAWATWPAADQINVESCSPDGLFATLSAAIHGKAFWRVQLADIARRWQSAENWDQNHADMKARDDDIVRQSEEYLNAIREAYPSLRQSEAQVAAKRFRDLADKIERDEADRIVSEAMRKQATALKQCEEAIIARVR